MAAERVDAAAAAAAEAAAKAADATDALGRPIGGSAGGPEVQQAPGETEEEGVDFHKPKVATWGVFPRPRNISEAYGGGRNLRPGQDLETAEQAAQRKQRVSEALASYRKQMGLEIDPEIEAQAQKLFEDGEALFKAGRISAALDKFSTAADLVPLRSRIGGQVNLQKAICLDSLGRNDDAYAIYTKLEGHNAPGVAKATKRMLFGFKAAKNLKVETMSYSGGGTQAWKQYFDRIGAGTWAAYKASGEESEEDAAAARQAGLVAAAVVLLPFAFVGILIAK